MTDLERFLSFLPTDGSTIGNVSLRNLLRWEEEKYWAVQKEALAKKYALPGKGRGGSVRRGDVSLPVVLENPSVSAEVSTLAGWSSIVLPNSSADLPQKEVAPPSGAVHTPTMEAAPPKKVYRSEPAIKVEDVPPTDEVVALLEDPAKVRLALAELGKVLRNGTVEFHAPIKPDLLSSITLALAAEYTAR